MFIYLPNAEQVNVEKAVGMRYHLADCDSETMDSTPSLTLYFWFFSHEKQRTGPNRMGCLYYFISHEWLKGGYKLFDQNFSTVIWFTV